MEHLAPTAKSRNQWARARSWVGSLRQRDISLWAAQREAPFASILWMVLPLPHALMSSTATTLRLSSPAKATLRLVSCASEWSLAGTWRASSHPAKPVRTEINPDIGCTRWGIPPAPKPSRCATNFWKWRGYHPGDKIVLFSQCQNTWRRVEGDWRGRDGLFFAVKVAWGYPTVRNNPCAAHDDPPAVSDSSLSRTNS